jgi:hypothetical protein
MYCPSCEKQIPDGSTFCSNCGARTSAPTALTTEQSARPAPSTPSAILGGNVGVSAPSTTPFPVPTFPGTAPKPWYRSTGCLVIAFLLFTPLWSILILTDKEAKTWVKVVAGVFLALAILYWLIVLLSAAAGSRNY